MEIFAFGAVCGAMCGWCAAALIAIRMKARHG